MHIWYLFIYLMLCGIGKKLWSCMLILIEFSKASVKAMITDEAYKDGSAILPPTRLFPNFKT